LVRLGNILRSIRLGFIELQCLRSYLECHVSSHFEEESLLSRGHSVLQTKKHSPLIFCLNGRQEDPLAFRKIFGKRVIANAVGAA